MRITETRLRQIIREELQQEISLSSIGHVILDIAGLIPGVGEVADVTNAVWHAKEGDYFSAALSLISIIPVIGDSVGKGGKLASWVDKNLPKVSDVLKTYGPEVLDSVKQAQEVIRSNRNLINKVLEKSEESAELKPYVNKIKQALDTFTTRKLGPDKLKADTTSFA